MGFGSPGNRGLGFLERGAMKFIAKDHEPLEQINNLVKSLESNDAESGN